VLIMHQTFCPLPISILGGLITPSQVRFVALLCRFHLDHADGFTGYYCVTSAYIKTRSQACDGRVSFGLPKTMHRIYHSNNFILRSSNCSTGE
jgi:hypothetical protein